ncbi:hypothetical protein BH18ACT9_BH18ACT9_07500 [soil metagenome]
MEPVPETEKALNVLLSYGDTEVHRSLLEMSRRAQEIVPECVGLSLGLIEDGLTFTMVASSAALAELDAVQYLDGGPCIAAEGQREPIAVNVADLMDEDRWLMYAQASSASGVASSLSLPLLRGQQVVGGINLYASTGDAFEGRHQELAEALGSSADGMITNADLEFSTRLEAAEAPARLADQDDIDVALGVVSASLGVDITTAHQRLRQAAARAGISEAQAARTLKHLYDAV